MLSPSPARRHDHHVFRSFAMNRRILAVLTFVIAFLLVPALAPAATIIHAGRLIDGRAAEVRTEVSLVIEDGKITRIDAGYVAGGPDDTVIDLKEGTVLPGLMDMHTHLVAQHSKESYTEKFFMEEADYALRSTIYARATLLAGF